MGATLPAPGGLGGIPKVAGKVVGRVATGNGTGLTVGVGTTGMLGVTGADGGAGPWPTL